MNFINLPVAFRGRRLIEVPSGRIINTELNAGYDPNIDATVTELPYKGTQFSLILIYLENKPNLLQEAFPESNLV